MDEWTSDSPFTEAISVNKNVADAEAKTLDGSIGFNVERELEQATTGVGYVGVGATTETVED